MIFRAFRTRVTGFDGLCETIGNFLALNFLSELLAHSTLLGVYITLGIVNVRRIKRFTLQPSKLPAQASDTRIRPNPDYPGNEASLRCALDPCGPDRTQIVA